MKINKTQASALCNDVINAIVKWPARFAALQSGGLEVKGSARIQEALEKWLANQHRGSKLYVLREYRHIDYSLIDKSSILKPRLRVEAILEVKFNYAKQLSTIARRIPKALTQAADYQKKVKSQYAYVLYLIASPSTESKPSPAFDSDSGWSYWEKFRTPSTLESALEHLARSVNDNAIGSVRGHLLSAVIHDAGYCCALIQCVQTTSAK